MTSLNENAYGGLADSVAKNYGIPTDIFRDVIRKASNFDPLYSSPTGKGIAGINADFSGKNPMSVGDGLETAAKVLSAAQKASDGDWIAAAREYLGVSDSSSDGKTLAENEAALNGESGSAAENGNKSWIDNILDGVKNWLKTNAYGAIFIIIGLLMIIATVWALIKNSSTK